MDEDAIMSMIAEVSSRISEVEDNIWCIEELGADGMPAAQNKLIELKELLDMLKRLLKELKQWLSVKRYNYLSYKIKELEAELRRSYEQIKLGTIPNFNLTEQHLKDINDNISMYLGYEDREGIDYSDYDYNR